MHCQKETRAAGSRLVIAVPIVGGGGVKCQTVLVPIGVPSITFGSSDAEHIRKDSLAIERRRTNHCSDLGGCEVN
jgi:hypothetical protein